MVKVGFGGIDEGEMVESMERILWMVTSLERSLDYRYPDIPNKSVFKRYKEILKTIERSHLDRFQVQLLTTPSARL